MNETRKKRKIWPSVLLTALLAVGVGVLLYPTVSDRLNQYRQTRVITEYTGSIDNIDEAAAEEALTAAEEYNERLAANQKRFIPTEEDREEYSRLLDLTGTGIMGHVQIPGIRVDLPIYHDLDDEALEEAIVHYEGTSLPVGGAGTHAVISGHRGLASARLFTDIDQLKQGDHFLIKVLNRTLTYEVDQIRTVLPDEKDDLAIDPEKDYCTLMTCTPYGINTHRLLVRGTRIPNDEQEIEAAAGLQVNTLLLILLTAAPALLFVIILLVILAGRKR